MDRRDVANKAAIVADGYFTKPYDDSYLPEQGRSPYFNGGS